MTRPRCGRRMWTSLLGAGLLFCASQGLLAILYAWSGRLGGWRWDSAEPLPGPFAVSAASYPWATWTAFLLATAAFPLVWERLMGGAAVSGIGFRAPERPLLAGAWAAACAALLAAYAALALSIFHRAIPHVLAPGNTLFFALQWGFVALGEETLYRGVLQRRLSDALGPLLGILVASAIWAFVGHVRVPPLENLVLRLPAGLLLGILYARSKSLYPPILAHWLLNLAVTAGL